MENISKQPTMLLVIPASEWLETQLMLKSLCDKVGALVAPQQKELLSPKEVCHILKIGRTTFERYKLEGLFEIIRPNDRRSGKLYVRRSELEKLISDGTFN